jgi:hypothetical protein
MKTKVKIQADWYGAIDEIREDGIINARLYDANTHEMIDDIEFPLTNFPEHQHKDVVLNVLFTLRIGRIGKKPFANFRVKYRDPNFMNKTPEEIQEIVDDLIKVFK